jgi:hypothetical protein
VSGDSGGPNDRAVGSHQWNVGGPHDRRGRDAAVVARAVLAHPELWWASVGAVRRMARRGWWRRPPFLPMPGAAYWRFRLVTANGGDGETDALAPSDVISYLRWCRRSRPRRG